jgi:dihydrofolate reductase
MFVTYWPEVKPGDDDKPFADKLNAIPKIVFSKTLERASWGKWDNARLVRTEAADEVRRLRQGSGGNMVIWGSISLAQSLLHERLIDEVQLIVCPVVLGRGTRLFSDSDSLQMQLRRTSSFDRGRYSSRTPVPIPLSDPTSAKEAP